jgi:hypothetical protein
MEELKTLKDICECAYPDPCNCYPDKIRLEAIKWIKDMDFWVDNVKVLAPLNATKEKEAVKRWIKHFFNIKEEELQ